jgi:beta-xylosidase
MKPVAIIILCVAASAFVTLADPSPYGTVNAADPSLQIPADTKPLLDYWMRDTFILLGPDGFYYLTGTTADPHRHFDAKGPHCWDWNDGIYLWRSADLKKWDSLGLVWSLDEQATWQKPFVIKKAERHVTGYMMGAKRRAVWAPQLHYIKSATNWFLVACMNTSIRGAGSFILRSLSGLPQGPYENIPANATGPIFPQIDGALFEDDDGTAWFLAHNHQYAKMKSDMTGFGGPLQSFRETPYPKEPYLEGVTLFKTTGVFHLLQAAWSIKMPDGSFIYDDSATRRGGIRWSYDCVIADSDKIGGPYGPRYTAGVGLGHNTIFQDKQGNWWSTVFGNPRGSSVFKQPFLCRPALIRMHSVNGRLLPLQP